MVVVASIGNSGADGLYAAGAPGVGDKVIGTASYDNSHTQQIVFRVSPDNLGIPFSSAAGAPPAPTSGSLLLAKTGTPASAADGCLASDFAGIPAGRAVLIRRGGCTFYVKAFNAMTAGAAAVVLYNNVAGALSPTVAGSPPITIPVVAITAADGALLNGRIASGPTTLTWTNETGTFVNPTGGLISSFSSYGMTADLILKPDIGAPGGLIRSTYPLEQGSYATISGTSMASPHVAGAAALLKQARPGLAASAFRAILQNSADPKNWSGSPGLGFLDFVHRQGAGMVDVDDAIASTTTVTPGKLSFGEGSGGSGTLSIANASSSAQTYAVSHVAALATGPAATQISPFGFGVFLGSQTPTFSSSSVTVPAGGTGSLDVSIAVDPASLPAQSQYGGYIVLTRQSDGQVFRVPYAGFLGDYQSIVAMPSRAPFPAIGKETAINTFSLAATHRGVDAREHGRDPERAHPLRPPGATPGDPGRRRRDRSSVAPGVLQRVRAGLPVAEPDGDRVLRVSVERWPAPLERAGLEGGPRLEDGAGRPVQADRQGAQGARRQLDSRRLGDLDVTDDHDRPAVTGPFSRVTGRAANGGPPASVEGVRT